MKELSNMGVYAYQTIKGGVVARLDGKDQNDAILFESHCDTLGAMVHQVKSNGRLKMTNIGGMNPNNAEAENVRIITRKGDIYEGTCQLIDDKLSAAVLLGYAKYVSDNKIELDRTVYMHFTIYEEVGHGGASPCPDGVTEAWSVDMGCVGEGLNCTEKEVSIAAKDRGGPYNYDVVNRLIDLADKYDIGYAVDIYPYYGSDVEATLAAGHDIRHGLIGPGVYASHGYERSHIEGAENTFRLIQAYLED